jgi:phosphoribosyl-AMP cyclohydrolase
MIERKKFDTFAASKSHPSGFAKSTPLSINPERMRNIGQAPTSGPKNRRIDLKNLKLDKLSLIPAIIQDYKTGDVLMLAYMNQESLRRSIKSGKTCFWSRSRSKYWVKGETSGNFQFIKSISYDCDMDALLIKVRQIGVACHTGNRSCFYRKIRISQKEKVKM